MKNAKLIFHRMSYLQYPLMLIALAFAGMAAWVVIQTINAGKTEFSDVWEFANYTLIFMGLGISFSTLQDTSKTQNNFSLKVWQDPKKSRIFLIIMLVSVLTYIGSGLVIMFAVNDPKIEQLSLGLIVLGIGLLGMLKTAVEMAEHHKIEQ